MPDHEWVKLPSRAMPGFTCGEISFLPAGAVVTGAAENQVLSPVERDISDDDWPARVRGGVHMSR